MQNIGFCSWPLHGIAPTGDGFSWVQKGTTTRLMLADGIGHGSTAHQIVTGLINQFQWLSTRSQVLPSIAECFLNLDRMLKRMDQQTAQAAVAITDIDIHRCVISSAGIGNVETFYFCLGAEQQFTSMKGMVGGRMPSQFNLHHAPLESPSIIALITDGIDRQSARSSLRAFSASSSLRTQRPQLLAEHIVKTSSSSFDDASCALMVVLP